MQVAKQKYFVAGLIMRAGSDYGAAFVEFALIMPVLILFALGAIDYGGAANLSTKLSSAARAGTQYGLYHPSDTCGILNAVTAATTNSTMTVKMTNSSGSLASITSSNCSTSTAYYCTCGTSSATSTDCSTGVCTSPAFKNFYVAVSVTETYQPTIIAASLPVVHATGLPSSSGFAMTRSATVQFQ